MASNRKFIEFKEEVARLSTMARANETSKYLAQLNVFLETLVTNEHELHAEIREECEKKDSVLRENLHRIKPALKAAFLLPISRLTEEEKHQKCLQVADGTLLSTIFDLHRNNSNGRTSSREEIHKVLKINRYWAREVLPELAQDDVEEKKATHQASFTQHLLFIKKWIFNAATHPDKNKREDSVADLTDWLRNERHQMFFSAFRELIVSESEIKSNFKTINAKLSAQFKSPSRVKMFLASILEEPTESYMFGSGITFYDPSGRSGTVLSAAIVATPKGLSIKAIN